MIDAIVYYRLDFELSYIFIKTPFDINDYHLGRYGVDYLLNNYEFIEHYVVSGGRSESIDLQFIDLQSKKKKFFFTNIYINIFYHILSYSICTYVRPGTSYIIIYVPPISIGRRLFIHQQSNFRKDVG